MRWIQFVVMALLCAAPLQAAAVCAATATPATFGNYNSFSTAPLDRTASITVACTGGLLSIGLNYNIKLSAGSSGSFSARRMTKGTARLNYNLYTNSSRTSVWGNGSGGSSTVSDGYLLGLLTVTRNYTVYGRLPARQNVAAGLYSDTVIVTIDY